MSNTYWNGNGTYQSIADKLEKLVPATGPAECKHIDRFRKQQMLTMTSTIMVVVIQ